MVAAAKPEHERTAWERFCKDVVRDKWLYLLLLPGIVFLIIFRYIPIFGNVIAFMDYNPFDTSQSVWVGFKHFQDLLTRPQFLQVFGNTLYISILKMVCGFPIPIILALMMNEMKNLKFKKVAQTLLYLPNFISWVVLAGLIMNMLDPDTGARHRHHQFHRGRERAGAHRHPLLRPDADRHRHLQGRRLGHDHLLCGAVRR